MTKLYRGFESLSLRHAVCTAEKIRTSRFEIREKCQYFAIIARRTGLERMAPSISQADFVTFFSVGRFSSSGFNDSTPTPKTFLRREKQEQLQNRPTRTR